MLQEQQLFFSLFLLRMFFPNPSVLAGSESPDITGQFFLEKEKFPDIILDFEQRRSFQYVPGIEPLIRWKRNIANVSPAFHKGIRH